MMIVMRGAVGRLLLCPMALESFFYNNPLPCWIFETSSKKFLAVNRACSELFDYDEDIFLDRLFINDLLCEDQSCDSSKPSTVAFARRDGSVFELLVYPRKSIANGLECCMVTAVPLASILNAGSKVGELNVVV